MNRRSLIARIVGLMTMLFWNPARAAAPIQRVRPGDAGWPDAAAWARLIQEVGGQLAQVQSPLQACVADINSPACRALEPLLKNPFAIGDDVALTQTFGWVDAWTSQPSAYAVAARNTKDVVAAVNFARTHNLRLVVKGGGHSYLGTSNAADSLLIWTRPMNAVSLHDSFTPQGCAQSEGPALSVGAGALWLHAYDAATTKGGRYVQGGGCTTVGVAGLIQSGGFGSFSKNYGMAAASLLEAEVVTADGEARIANACTHPDLFWGLKGGGGGSLGVVTRLTLRTHALPNFFGGMFATIRANSDAAFRRLIGETVRFYAQSLFNPHWGEQIAVQRDNVLSIAMVFQGLTKEDAEAVWRPLFAWIAAAPQDFTLAQAPQVIALPARHFWDPAVLRKVPGIIVNDERPGAPETNFIWAGDQGQAGQVMHGYQSTWLPATLLREERQERLADALFAASRQWRVSLHCNKGLAGAPEAAIAAARDTATNPAALGAFALAISAAQGPPAYPGIVGREPNVVIAREQVRAVDRAMGELRRLVPGHGSYVSESDFFERDWQRAYWGGNYPRLLAVKDKYDPEGLFFVHHGVGSERWSADGFSRVR